MYRGAHVNANEVVGEVMLRIKARAKAVEKIVGSDWKVRVIGDTPHGLDITPEGSGGITFAMLNEISKACETKNINVRYSEGWGGSDVTPGDPDEVIIEILK